MNDLRHHIHYVGGVYFLTLQGARARGSTTQFVDPVGHVTRFTADQMVHRIVDGWWHVYDAVNNTRRSSIELSQNSKQYVRLGVTRDQSAVVIQDNEGTFTYVDMFDRVYQWKATGVSTTPISLNWNGEVCAYVVNQRELHVHSQATGLRVFTMDKNKRLGRVALSQDGTLVACVVLTFVKSTVIPSLIVLNLETEEYQEQQTPTQNGTLAFSLDGTLVVAIDHQRTIRLYHPTQGLVCCKHDYFVRNTIDIVPM